MSKLEVSLTLSLDAETRAALEAITTSLASAAQAQVQAPAPAPAAKPAPAPVEDDPFGDTPAAATAAATPKTYTREEIRTALKGYADKYSKEKAIQVLKDHGAASIGELAVDKFAAVFVACS